jgi:hypothetical protein
MPYNQIDEFHSRRSTMRAGTGLSTTGELTDSDIVECHAINNDTPLANVPNDKVNMFHARTASKLSI